MVDPDPVHGPRLVVSPSKIVLGKGALGETGQHVGVYGDRALVVATPQIFDIHGDRLLSVLDEAEIETTLYTDVRPDPTVENIETAFSRWTADECEVIVTLGGGSSIDVGKAVGILAGNGGEIRDYGVDRAGYEGVPNPTPPLVAVNTTTGTGSEATRSVVVTDESTDTKFLIVSQHVVPDVAVEDPELVTTLPRSHTAFTSIDALTHAIEAYVSVKSYSVPADFALNAIRKIADAFTKSWANGEDLEARTTMLIAQLQAGQAFTNASVALVHGMARPLGAQCHLPHGLANAILLPYVMEFSAMAAPEKYAEVARIFEVADDDTPDRVAADRASDAVLDLCADVNLASYLDDYGEIPTRADYLEVVPKMAQDAIDSGSPDNNPRKPTKAEIEDLFVRVYDDALAPDSPRRS